MIMNVVIMMMYDYVSAGRRGVRAGVRCRAKCGTLDFVSNFFRHLHYNKAFKATGGHRPSLAEASI